MNESTEMSNDDHRVRLIADLEDYRRRFPAEDEVVSKLIDFVRREARCFERSTPEGHITGSAWLVDPSNTSVLLTHHRKLNRWLQLGGHADGNGDVRAVALLEAKEESGISNIRFVRQEIFDVDIHSIPARGTDPEHLHYDIRFLLQAETTDHVVGEESHDLEWIAASDLESRTTESSMVRMAAKWRSRYVVARSIDIGASAEAVFDFHLDTRNLLRISPPNISVTIESMGTPGLGYETVLRVRQFGFFTTRWHVRITQCDRPTIMVDEQLRGPFRSWKQTRLIESTSVGSRLTDIVEYDIPFGHVGAFVHRLVIWRKILDMFSYRQQRTREILEESSTYPDSTLTSL
ncbi:MAG TPA: NUDIX domain-containing protein [Chlorobiota bacterium]|nr:NUDIX domain-containing protein [Chlorobiota bacterium]